ncbi:MAG: penicillin acylase family protein [Rhodospirillales bacterium]|jgi:penicillin amidase|nr:penicillin acylase family protein [Rhodospirillales bacterium]
MSRIRSSFTVFLSLALILLFGAVGWVLSSLPPEKLEISSRNVRHPVTVYLNRDAVPYIHADSFRDAAFALGYIHAQNRMWQMELQRRIGAGRLSEILGRRSIATDRFFRTLGVYRLAAASFAGLPAGLRAHLAAYAAGVNAWIESHAGALPPEFLVLRHRPEPWRPADSLVWGKLMALRLSGNYRDELLRARMLTHLSFDQVDALWPGYPADAPVTVTEKDHAGIIGSGNIAPLTGSIAGAGASPRGASNAWALSGAHTDTGAPILANDPHLGFAAPILWYLAKIILPGGFVAGATVPGVPFVIAGHNSNIAWGLTAAQSDVEDIFIETSPPGRPGVYDAPDGPKPFSMRDEIIRVRGAKEIRLKVRTTRHGPIISDLRPDAHKTGALALAATFLEPGDRTSETIYRLNLARGKADFIAALGAMNAFQLNFMFADKAGSIGFYAAGKVPVRTSGSGFYARPGGAGQYDWRGFIPFEELPHEFDPGSGFLVNANNAVAGPGYPHFLSRDWAAPYRARRIKQMLRGGGPFTVDRAKRMQADKVSLMARDLVGPMTEFQTDDARLKRVVRLLRAWDGRMHRSRPEPLIFSAWLRAFNKSVYADELGGDFRQYWRLRPRFIRQVLTVRPQWCDRRGTPVTETCPELLSSSLIETLDHLAKLFGSDDIAGWRWGEVHQARFEHMLFRGIPAISWLTDLKIPSDGGDYTVSRGATRPASEGSPHAHIHGAGYRAIYDLKSPGNSRYVIATGQSGNPLSVHYRDFLKRWRDVAYIRLNESRNQLERSARTRFQFTPAAGD